jgi:ribosomal protein S18 acetylase RimI-like enzyme
MGSMIQIDRIDEPSQNAIREINDLYRLAGWWGPAPDDPRTIERLVRGSYCFVTATETDAVIGMGRAISDGVSDAYIQDVVVRPGWRGRGIASRIIEALVKALQAEGIEWIGLIAEGDSHPLYRRLGFAPMENALPMRYRKKDAIEPH